MDIKILGTFLVGIGIAIFIGGYLFARLIKQYDENFKELFKTKSEFDQLKGEHNAMSKRHTED